MLRRLFITIVLITIPATCLADAAADLGPAASSPAASSQAMDSSMLQAGASRALQAIPDAQSQSLSASTLNTLQPTADKLAVTSYLAGEADSAPQDPNTPDYSSWITVGSLAAMIILYVLYYTLTTRHIKKHYARRHA